VTVLRAIQIDDLRAYRRVAASFGTGPQLVWGPNAAGKTSLIEAIVLLAWGRSHRTTTDADLVRWGAPFSRIEGLVAAGPGAIEPGAAGSAGAAGSERRPPVAVEVVVARSGAGTRKRIRVDGVGRRASGLGGVLRVVVFAPEEMLLVVGPPSLRRDVLDRLAGQLVPAYADDLATYGRAVSQRNQLLRQVRDEGADRTQLRFWTESCIELGAALVAGRLRVLEALAGPLAAAHRLIAPEEAVLGVLGLDYRTTAPPRAGESLRDALRRRFAETAEKELWNGTTLIGPHRDDVAFVLGGRDLAGFASRGQQRTAILALKLAELDLLAGFDGRPPLLLLDDVFSELDPDRRAHLVRRIGELPQAFVTTTSVEDLDGELVRSATAWRVVPQPDGACLVGPGSADDPDLDPAGPRLTVDDPVIAR
jgi:DNA replication and repair protein RecF